MRATNYSRDILQVINCHFTPKNNFRIHECINPTFVVVSTELSALQLTAEKAAKELGSLRSRNEIKIN